MNADGLPSCWTFFPTDEESAKNWKLSSRSLVDHRADKESWMHENNTN